MTDQGAFQDSVMADLRAEKARRFLTADDMAAHIGVGADWVRRRIRKRNAIPVSLSDLERLCATVGVRPVVYLIPIEAPDPIPSTNHHNST